MPSMQMADPIHRLVHAAKERGAYTVEINPATTGATAHLDLVIPLPAEDALPLLDH
jgi:hypothetical protein